MRDFLRVLEEAYISIFPGDLPVVIDTHAGKSDSVNPSNMYAKSFENPTIYSNGRAPDG